MVPLDASRLLVASDAWRSGFPGAVAGALVMNGVCNPEHSGTLEARKRHLEDELRAAAVEGPAGDRIQHAYADYYRRHGKTYHVTAQRESVAVKARPIPSRAALVEAMFMAELKNLILTAGHDCDRVVPPVTVGVTAEHDRYVLLGGTEAVLRGGDMMMTDREGIISSVLRGPDRRTRITRRTRNVLFAAYAPAGIGEHTVRAHLENVRDNVLLVAPDAQTAMLATLPAA